jgi:hypothetical protein
MVIEERKWGFRSALVILDDEEARRLASQDAHSRIIVVSHHHLNLPGFSVREKQTGVIDLDAPLEGVRSRFSKTVRNEVSKTERDARFTFRTEEQNIPEDAYALYAASEKVRGRRPFPRRMYAGAVWALGYYDSELLAGIALYPSAPVARIRSIFSKRLLTHDHDLYNRIGQASRRLMLELCRWGIEHGRTGIDLASVNTADEDKAGITAYKLSFAPRLIPEYTYTRRTRLYALLERLRAAVN